MKGNKLIILTVVVISVVLIGFGATSATLASSNQPTRGLIQDKEEAAGMTWNLAHDFRASPNQANPNPDSYGNSDTWSFMHSTTAHDPSTYSLVTQYFLDHLGYAGLQGWNGPEPCSGFPDCALPSFVMNTTGLPIVLNANANYPPGVIVVHPDSTQPAIVGWHSPFTGSIAIVGGVTDLNSSNGDGILWYIDKNSSTVASGAYPNGGAQLFRDGAQGSQLGNIAVKKGDFIYFLIAPGGDYYSDATQLDVTITMVSLSTTPTATFTPTRTPTPTPTATCPAVPNKPMLLAPPNGSAIGKAHVVLSWGGDPCAVEYKVKVHLRTKNGPTVQKGTTPLTEFQTKALAPATYFWNVRACNAVGCTGSNWWQFTVK